MGHALTVFLNKQGKHSDQRFGLGLPDGLWPFIYCQY